MNFALAREIYGLTTWCMDTHSLHLMGELLEDIRNGVELKTSDTKLNTPVIYKIKSAETISLSRDEVTVLPAETEEEAAGVAIIPLNGPITKAGGESSTGMVELSDLMFKLNQDDRIKSFIILADSGGGSSNAVRIMVDAINTIKQTKPVFGLVEKGGLAASACYGILSACNEIYAEDNMSIVGSIGTMMQFEGFAANTKDSTGKKHIRLYATKSIKKNEAFEQALNNDNYISLINDVLDPINTDFINMVADNRPQLKEMEFDDGKTYFASEAIGTFLDGIKSFTEVVNLSLQYEINNFTGFKKPEKKTKIDSKLNFKSKKMITEEFKTANPEAYASIIAEGIALEQDRAGAWLAHVTTDPEAVVIGINSGKAITQTEREAFFVKQNAAAQAKSMCVDSAQDITVQESKSINDVVKSEKEKELKAAFDFNLN